MRYILLLLVVAFVSCNTTKKTGCEWKKPRRAVYRGFL